MPLLLLNLEIARGVWGGDWGVIGGSVAGGGGDVGEWAMKSGSAAGGGGEGGVVGDGDF